MWVERGQQLVARPAPLPGRPDADDDCDITKLALLPGCIPVTPVLQRVAVRTMQLALELGASVDVGLPWCFPGVFPVAVTWDT